VLRELGTGERTRILSETDAHRQSDKR